MLPLHPVPEVRHSCPECGQALTPVGWYMPGMRTLADLVRRGCGVEYYGDLWSAHGLHYPMLLNKRSGEVHDPYGVEWFAEWLRRSYAERTDRLPGFTAETFKPLRKPVILNCLHCRYGDGIQKLLSAQYYLDHQPDFDLVVLAPAFLRWMVPQGVAAVWSVDAPLRELDMWSDGLAAEIRRRIEPAGKAWLSVTPMHADPGDYDVERYTGVRPFPMDEWTVRIEKPVVTLLWREDESRLWFSPGAYGLKRQILMRLMEGCGQAPGNPLRMQSDCFARLAGYLPTLVPGVEIAVAGLGTYGRLPKHVTDMRADAADTERERAWCRQYARSQVVVGVHGSHLLLPTLHAGAALVLVPDRCWPNMLQDTLTREPDPRMMGFRCRNFPLETSPLAVARTLRSMLLHMVPATVEFSRPWTRHAELSRDPTMILRKRYPPRSGRG